MLICRAFGSYDVDAASLEAGLDCGEEDLTKQEFAEEVDINTLVRRFNLTGQLPSGVRMPSYGDFTEVTDFHSAVNAIAEAHEAFDAMPAEVRFRFQNNPAAFVDFCSDPSNLAEARKMGLVPPEEVRPAESLQAGSGERVASPGASAAPVVAPATSGGSTGV